MAQPLDEIVAKMWARVGIVMRPARLTGPSEFVYCSTCGHTPIGTAAAPPTTGSECTACDVRRDLGRRHVL
jgi:hypothetical protein